MCRIYEEKEREREICIYKWSVQLYINVRVDVVYSFSQSYLNLKLSSATNYEYEYEYMNQWLNSSRADPDCIWDRSTNSAVKQLHRKLNFFLALLQLYIYFFQNIWSDVMASWFFKDVFGMVQLRTRATLLQKL